MHINNSNVLRRYDYVVGLIGLLLVPSAVVYGLLGLDERAMFALLAPVIVGGALVTNSFSIQKTVPIIVLPLTLIGVLASVFSNSTSQFLMGLTLSVAIVVGQQLYFTMQKPQLLRVVSWFVLLLLIGGVIGLLYSFLGGRPLFAVQVGYRTTYLFLTTFSFAVMGNFIRPSGIFDEPGSLVMYVTIVSMFNDVLRLNRTLTIVSIALLVFTGSLAGLFVALLFFLLSNSAKKYRRKSVGVSLALCGAIIIGNYAFSNNPLATAVDVFYSDRLQVVDGGITGDNRSNQVRDFLNLVDDDMLLRGQKISGKEYATADQSSNPFSLTYGYGLIISLPYFALLLWLAFITVRSGFRNSYTSLGLLSLLLQRPYIYHLSWSIMIAATVWLLYYVSKNQFQRESALTVSSEGQSA